MIDEPFVCEKCRLLPQCWDKPCPHWLDYDEGYRASEQGNPRNSNPNLPGSWEWQIWDSGYSQATDDLCGT